MLPTLGETIETDTPPQTQNGIFTTTTTESVMPNEIYKHLIFLQPKANVPKTRTLTHTKSKYRNCEDILEYMKPYLEKCSCGILMSDKVVRIGDLPYVEATATLFDVSGNTISVTAYARENIDKKGMDTAQITGATSSYARKYALNALFAIDDTKDPDANGGHSTPSKQVQSVPQAPPPLTEKIIKWAQGRIFEDKSDPIKMNVFLAELKTRYKVTPEEEDKINLGALMDEEDLK